MTWLASRAETAMQAGAAAPACPVTARLTALEVPDWTPLAEMTCQPRRGR